MHTFVIIRITNTPQTQYDREGLVQIKRSVILKTAYQTWQNPCPTTERFLQLSLAFANGWSSQSLPVFRHTNRFLCSRKKLHSKYVSLWESSNFFLMCWCQYGWCRVAKVYNWKRLSPLSLKVKTTGLRSNLILRYSNLTWFEKITSF